jgi:hypothetical protein
MSVGEDGGGAGCEAPPVKAERASEEKSLPPETSGAELLESSNIVHYSFEFLRCWWKIVGAGFEKSPAPTKYQFQN